MELILHDDLRILPDIYWGDSISIAPFLFSSEKLMLAIPPEGKCTSSVLCIEKFSYTPFEVEYKDGFYKKIEFNPRELLGLNDSVVQKIRGDNSIITIEWDLNDFKNRASYSLGVKQQLTPEKILKIGPYHEGIDVPYEKRKWFVALFNWAFLLNDINFDFEKCIIEKEQKTNDDPERLDQQKIFNKLVNKALELSIPNIEAIKLNEALDIKEEFKDYFQPFWRTIKRMQNDVVQAVIYEKDISDSAIDQLIHTSIRSNLGTTLSGWSQELNSKLIKTDSISSKKKYGKLFLDVLTGAIKKDIPKLLEALFDVPIDQITPTQSVEKDYDKTIMFLYYLKNKKK